MDASHSAEKDATGRPFPSRAIKVVRECAIPTSLGLMDGECEAFRLYIDRNDWWLGYYRGDEHHYVCPLPTVVIRWPRRVCPLPTVVIRWPRRVIPPGEGRES